MQIACPNCKTFYSIAPASVGEGGRMVRCARCHELWFVDAPQFEAIVIGERAPAGTFEPPQSDADIDWHVGGTPLRDYAMGTEADARTDDIEFATPQNAPHVDDAPPIASGVDDGTDAMHAAEAAASADGSEPDYFEVRRRRAQRQKPKKSAVPWISAPRLIAVQLAIMLLLVYQRDNVVRLMPQMASFYGHLGMPINLRGLAFEDVKTINEIQDGVSVLVIEGMIRNLTRHRVEVPRLRFAMRNASGAETYSWTGLPERAMLPAGEAQIFRTRLASPPADSQDTYVRFIQRRDMTGSGKGSDPKVPDHTKPSDHKL